MVTTDDSRIPENADLTTDSESFKVLLIFVKRKHYTDYGYTINETTGVLESFSNTLQYVTGRNETIFFRRDFDEDEFESNPKQAIARSVNLVDEVYIGSIINLRFLTN